MRTVKLTNHDLSAPEKLHDKLDLELDFPEHYGRNLAALSDCLTDIDEPTTLVLSNHHGASETTEFARRALRVFRRCADENPNLFLEQHS